MRISWRSGMQEHTPRHANVAVVLARMLARARARTCMLARVRACTPMHTHAPSCSSHLPPPSSFSGRSAPDGTGRWGPGPGPARRALQPTAGPALLCRAQVCAACVWAGWWVELACSCYVGAFVSQHAFLFGSGSAGTAACSGRGPPSTSYLLQWGHDAPARRLPELQQQLDAEGMVIAKQQVGEGAGHGHPCLPG